MVTLGEVGETISQTIKNILTMFFDVLTPILTALGVAQIVVGLLLALGLRQEFIGYRLCVGGILTLVTAYVIVPLLLGFI